MTRCAAGPRALILLSVALLLLAALPAAARVEKTMALTPGGTFVLDAEGSKIVVTGSDRTDIHMVMDGKNERTEARFDLQIREEPGRVEVRCHRKHAEFLSWINFSMAPDLTFEVEVPRQVALDLRTAGSSITVESIQGHVRLRSAGGSLDARAVEGDVDAHTSGGSIKLEKVTGSVSAETSGGGIQAREVRGKLDAQSSGGGIEIVDAGGRVQAGTSGGSARVAFAAGNSEGGEISASGGGVHVELDAAAGVELDASASGGSVKCELPISIAGSASSTQLHGRIGAGGPALKLRASGGSVRVQGRATG
jgi:DUF4097 and DUF4098 domain-containing protein YvlB